MATIRFYTRTKIDDRLAPVYIRFTDGRQINIRIPTPFKLFAEYWNEERQALKQRILYNDEFTEAQAKDIEDRFIQLKDAILREHFKLTGPASKEWLKQVIDKFYYKEAPREENLNQYIKRFIEEARSGKRLATVGTTKKRYSAGSIRVLNDFKNSFRRFQGMEPDEGTRIRKQAKKFPKQPYKPRNFNDVNIDMYNEFVQYFYSRECGANYIGKHIKSLKTIMRQSREEGLHNNQEIERKAFKTLVEETEKIYLTEAELQKLYDLDLSAGKHYERIRDVFLVGCYLAQRYSDYKRINKSMIKVIDNQKYVEIIQKKTGEKCIIPLSPKCDTILKKYDYSLPKTLEQKMNAGIKVIAEMAGIKEKIQVEKNKGGMKVKTTVKKCELVVTHSARRSGCTLMYLAGIPILDIMKISGHKTPKEFLKYVRIGKEETAVKLSSHRYFTEAPLKAVK